MVRFETLSFFCPKIIKHKNGPYNKAKGTLSKKRKSGKKLSIIRIYKAWMAMQLFK